MWRSKEWKKGEEEKDSIPRSPAFSPSRGINTFLTSSSPRCRERLYLHTQVASYLSLEENKTFLTISTLRAQKDPILRGPAFSPSRGINTFLISSTLRYLLALLNKLSSKKSDNKYWLLIDFRPSSIVITVSWKQVLLNHPKKINICAGVNLRILSNREPRAES